MNKIYVVETASYYANSGDWETNTSTNYFACKARAMAFCEKWMAQYKRDYPDGYASEFNGCYQFHHADGCIDEYQVYSAELQ